MMVSATDEARHWRIVFAMGFVIGVILLDETVVSVALPSIGRDFGLSPLALHWVVNAYLLVFAALAAAGGKLADMFGHRNMFLIGVVLFAGASALCGFAPSGPFLIAARAVQGIGAAIIFPLSMAMITLIFPIERRGAALGIYGAIGTFFLALGPLVGGVFTDLLSWRWIFWINLPLVAAVAAVVLYDWSNPVHRGEAPRLDIRGLLLLVTGLALLVFALMQGEDWGWSNPWIVGLLIVGVVSLVLFVAVELRIPSPLIEVDLFRDPAFSIYALAIFAAQFTKIAVIVFGAHFLQERLHMDPLTAGLALMVSVIMAPFLAGPSGRLADRFGARPLVRAALLSSTLGLLWTAHAVGLQSYALMVPGLLLWNLGTIFMFAPPRSALIKAVPEEKHGLVGGIAMTAQLLGGTLGMAVASTVFSVTGDYSAVFVANAVLVAILFLLSIGFIRDRATASKQ